MEILGVSIKDVVMAIVSIVSTGFAIYMGISKSKKETKKEAEQRQEKEALIQAQHEKELQDRFTAEHAFAETQVKELHKTLTALVETKMSELAEEVECVKTKQHEMETNYLDRFQEVISVVHNGINKLSTDIHTALDKRFDQVLATMQLNKKEQQ